MSKVWYAVTATLPNPALAEEYLAWLEGGHVEQVLKCGAHAASIVVLEPPPGEDPARATPRIMTQYIFSTRELFDEYVEHHAPALRAEGVQKFAARGVNFERHLGHIV